MLIKIGNRWFTAQGFKLTEVDAPADPPAEGSYYDGDSLAAELDGLDVDSLKSRTADIVADYNTALEAANGASNKTNLETARAKQLPAIIAHHLRTERIEAQNLLQDAIPPNAPDPEVVKPDPKPTTDVDPDPEPTEDDAGDGDADPGDGDIDVPDDLSSLPDADQALVSAVAAAATSAAIRARGRGVDADQVARHLPGAAPTGAAPATAERAVFTASGDVPGVRGGDELDGDAIADGFKAFARGHRAGRLPGSVAIGSWDVFGPEPDLVVASAELKDGKGFASKDFHERRAGHHRVITAAADRCGPNDFRRVINYDGDNTAPVLGRIQQYPSPHCTLEYYRSISIADVTSGVGIWDDTARTAYQDALDTFLATPNATNLSALKAAEKTYVIADCPPTATATMLAIYMSLRYPNDLEFCSPEAIQEYTRTLERLWLRQRTANFLAVVATLSARVTVDASATPFVNTDQFDFDGSTAAVQLGATAVMDYVLSSLLPLGVMTERINAGNYVAVMPYGLQRLLELDGRLAEGVVALSDALGGIDVITSMDTATGTALPWSAAPTQDGSSVAFSTLLPPTDWDIHVMDPSDFFAISRPSIELGAQVTPETVGGNMVFGGFMESFEGYGKDGPHPSYVIAFSNLKYNGARPDKARPVGLL